MQETSDALSIVRDRVATGSAVDNYVSRLSAIQTLQKSLSSSQQTVSIARELKHKPRYMLRIGGVGLNMMTENLVTLGKSLDVLDMKSKSIATRSLDV